MTLAATGTEAEMDVIVGYINIVKGMPKKPVAVTLGRHPPVQQTWDGQGPTPIGWTKNYSASWVADADTAAVPIDDTESGNIISESAQSSLSGPQIAALAQALNNRSDVDLVTGAHRPKRNGGVGVAPDSAKNEPEGKPSR